MTVNIPPDHQIWGIDEDTFVILIHVSVLLGIIILPIFGFVVPIVMWEQGRKRSLVVDEHGKNVVNWVISLFLYLVISGIFCTMIIGCFFIPIILLFALITNIIGIVKAVNEVIWEYPLTIKFIK